MKKITLYIITFIFLFGCKQNNSDGSDTEIALIPAIPLGDKSMNTLSDDDVKAWKSDLAYLKSKILELHPNPFFSGNESEFNGMRKWIDIHIPNMNRSQIILSFMRLIALVGINGHDGHSGLWPYMAPTDFNLYPLRLYWFEDGLFIVDAEPNKELVGARLDSINGKSVRHLLEIVDPFISRDGPMWVRSWAPIHILSKEFQQVLGFYGENGMSSFSISINGEISSVNLQSLPHEDYHKRFPMYLWQGILPFADSPPYLNPKDDYYWYEEWSENRSLYFQFNAVTSENKAGKKLDAIINELRNILNSGRVDRLIIDARLNGGGDNTAYINLLNFITEDSFFMESGKLFIIIGRATFSAGINFITEVEQKSNAILVGEPTGGSPNQYGDAKGITLPNSGIRLRISTLYWNKAGNDDLRLDHKPSLLTPVNSSDYFSRKDSAIEEILKHK